MGISTASEMLSRNILLDILNKSQDLDKVAGYEVLRVRKEFRVPVFIHFSGEETEAQKVLCLCLKTPE